jgi:adenylate kinase
MKGIYKGNIVLLGPPGAGKGTVAESLVDSHGYVLISTGDILREEKKSGSEIGKKIVDLIGKGNLVPDELIFEIIEKKVSESEGPFLIDGTPRTIPQGEFLEKKVDVGLVLFIDVSDKTTMERIKTRGKTSRREDDQDPKIAEKRLDQYKRETLPLVDFYKEMGKVVSIDGEKSPSDVMKQIENVLNLWK